MMLFDSLGSFQSSLIRREPRQEHSDLSSIACIVRRSRALKQNQLIVERQIDKESDIQQAHATDNQRRKRHGDAQEGDDIA